LCDILGVSEADARGLAAAAFNNVERATEMYFQRQAAPPAAPALTSA
jgi:hypothetical protein